MVSESLHYITAHMTYNRTVFFVSYQSDILLKIAHTCYVEGKLLRIFLQMWPKFMLLECNCMMPFTSVLNNEVELNGIHEILKPTVAMYPRCPRALKTNSHCSCCNLQNLAMAPFHLMLIGCKRTTSIKKWFSLFLNKRMSIMNRSSLFLNKRVPI